MVRALPRASGGARGGGGVGGGGGGGCQECCHPSTRHPAQQKLICTSTDGGTSAVSIVTRFVKAERRLIRSCLHDPLRRLTIGLGDREENNAKKIVHHKKLHPTQNPTQT